MYQHIANVHSNLGVKMHLETALFLMSYILEVISQSTSLINKVGLWTSTVTLDCPDQSGINSLIWQGPPSSTLYYLFSPDKGATSKVPAEKADRISMSNNFSLVISNTQLTDQGNYTCLVGVQNGNTLQTFTLITVLKVRSLPDAPEFSTSITEDNSRVRATEDTPFTVTCTSRGGNPAPSLVLYIGGVNVQEIARKDNGTQDGYTYVVTFTQIITPTRLDDRKQLVCRSHWLTAPAYPQESQQRMLFLYLKPTQPTLTQVVPVVTGNDITVECRTNGSRPEANISWTILGETLTGVTMVTHDDSAQTFTTASVLKRRVTSSDNGQNLTCKVFHIAGELTNTRTLNIQFAVPLSSTRITGNRAIIANGTNPLTLTCTTGSSNPASAITWRKGNSVINGDSPPTAFPGENNGVIREQVLTLRPTRGDNGETVACSVSSLVSPVTDTATVTLALHYSPLINTLTDQTVVEGDHVGLRCTADSNPAASFRWTTGFNTIDQGNGTASYNGLDYTITAVSRTQAATYNCTADNQIPPTDSRSTRLVVQYPPDVVVTVTNTTVNAKSTTLVCGASGVPDQYRYDNWVHTFNGVQVMHPESLPASRELTLSGLSYAHSGVYRCGASNGVKGVWSHDDETLIVQSFPIFIGDEANSGELKAYGQLMKPTLVTFQYYSNTGSSSVKVAKTNGSGENAGEFHQRSVDVKLKVFLSEITISGTEVTIYITVTEQGQFGEYQIVVTNEIGSANLMLTIQAFGPPETPIYLNSAVLDHQSVIFTWVPGLPNGLNQTFVIQISGDNSTWRNITRYGGMSIQQTHIQRVDNLAGSQVYLWRMLAVNEAGESQPTTIFTFETLPTPSTNPGPSIGAITGGSVAGGLVVALVVIVVVLVIMWRRRLFPQTEQKQAAESAGTKEETSGQKDRHDEGHTRTAVMTTDSSGAKLYETLGASDDTQCYQKLHENLTDNPQRVCDNTGMSQYEALQTNRQDKTSPYDQLIRNGHHKVYENLEVSSM